MIFFIVALLFLAVSFSPRQPRKFAQIITHHGLACQNIFATSRTFIAFYSWLTGFLRGRPLTSPLLSPGDQRQPKALPGSDLSVVADWPAKDTADKLGQISGVAVDIYGNAIIFHRGDRTWNGMTFKG